LQLAAYILCDRLEACSLKLAACSLHLTFCSLLGSTGLQLARRTRLARAGCRGRIESGRIVGDIAIHAPAGAARFDCVHY
jgi:hypothetical protein